MSAADWSLLSLLASAIEQCQSIEFMPLSSTDEYTVHCHCEEDRYLCLNVFETKSMVNLCYSYIFSKKYDNDDGQLELLTRVLLCYVSACLTSWNIRRRLVQSQAIDIPKELHFVELLLRLKPKNEQVFRYRRWLLQQIDRSAISAKKELEICDHTAERHFVNYASWLHRRWLVEYLAIDVDEELEWNRSWLERNLSDSSGFSFRAYLLARKGGCIEDELQLNATMLKSYFDRESLWIYRQSVILLAKDREALLRNERALISGFGEENLFSRRYLRLLEMLSSVQLS